MDKFIVVIEVDNKRALKAYSDAVSGLETLWSAIVAHCAVGDEKRQKKADDEMAKYEKELELFRKDADYRRYCLPILPFHCGHPPLRIHHFAHLKREVQRLMKLASVATAPFKVVENEAILLADIESGDWIRRIENELLGPASDAPNFAHF